MPINRVWVGQDADVDVYRTDKNGNRLAPDGSRPWVSEDGTALTYCLMQNTTLTGNLPTQRRPSTGRPKLRITATAYEYELDVGSLYVSKSQELDLNVIFNRNNWLELVLRLQAYDNPNAVELHTLKKCKANNFQITERDNENLVIAAKFLAEEFS